MSESSRAFSAFMPFMAFMSAPALNAFSPAPVSTTTCIVSSVLMSSMACKTSAVSSLLKAFSASGRLSVMVAMPSPFSYVMYLKSIFSPRLFLCPVVEAFARFSSEQVCLNHLFQTWVWMKLFV